MKPIAVQLGTVQEMAGKDAIGTLRKIADIGYAGVEMHTTYGMKPAELKHVLDDLGLAVTSSHSLSPQPSPEQFDMSVEWAKTFGFDTVIVAWAAPDNFQTLDAVRRFAGQLEALAGRLKPLGLKLGYHNHAHEMVKLGDDYALGRLYDLAPSLWGQTDIYWASNFGQVDTPAFVRRHAKRINSLHVKDGSFVPDQPMLAVGAGKVQTARCIQAADESVLRWLIVELDNCATDMLTAVRESYRFLVNNRLCVGKK